MNTDQQPPDGPETGVPPQPGFTFETSVEDVPPIVDVPDDDDTARPLTNAERFEAFHRANPHVYLKLRDIARHVKAKGASRFGIAAVFERLRWIYFETHGEAYRLNNTFRAFYARRLMAREPDLGGLFETRGDHAV